MRFAMTRKALRLTAAVLAAVFLWFVWTLPPRPAIAPGSVADAIRARTVAGAFHVHSARSDGAGDRAAIAAAAGRAGLKFVVITDHGDATRPPDPPAYVDGVLCVDAVEVSSNGGHLMALDMATAPYPLGGEASAVVEDVLRLGGMPVVTHPDSIRAELAWKDWDTPVAGLEWMNLDSGWRDERPARLARVAFDSLLRPGPALASMLDRPSSTLERWDRIAAARRLVGLAGHDAHGGLSWRSEGGPDWGIPSFLSLGLGSYDAPFATFGVRVLLDAPLTGDAATDARRLLDATRRGRLYTAIDAFAGPALVDYRATVGSATVEMGDLLPFADGATLSFRSAVPLDAVQVLLRDGARVAESRTGELTFPAPGPGAYRVEVRSPRWPVPWIVTNPIYLRQPDSDGPPDAAGPVPLTMLELTQPGVVEKDPVSTADASSIGGTRALTFGLRPGERVSQFVALAVRLPEGLPAFDRITFTGRSAAPMRVSVQVRFDGAGGARWRHSIYLSPEPREVVVPIDRLVPADQVRLAPPFDTASALLFVVDLTNASPGARGRFEISGLRLASVPQR
jgi:hypothetical protein